MTDTYRPLATVTLGSSAASVTFSSIPATYRDLILIVNGTPAINVNDSFSVRYNGDTGSNYSYVRMVGTSSNTATSVAESNNSVGGFFGGSQQTFILQVMDYSATDKHKSWLSRVSANWVGAWAGRWASTSAITSVNILYASAGFGTGTTFSLYGVIA
jgi:hypothetical protein